MKKLFSVSLLALSIGAVAAPAVQAQDFGERVARGIAREATGDYGRDYDRGYRRESRRDRFEGRSGYGDCRTVTIERDDGTVIRKRRCE